MKLNISRITENKDSLKSKENVVLELYEDKDNFIDYEFKTSKNNDNRLVFVNTNHRDMLNKHLIFEHFYVVLLVLLVVSGLALFSDSILMILLSFIGLIYVPFRLVSSSEVPYKLVFDGLNVYELNHTGKRVLEFSPTNIESSDSDKFENDFIFFSTSRSDKGRKSMMIFEGNTSEERYLFLEFYRKFNFKNSIKRVS
ncbi:hypothetical protein ITJ86_04190 [Winogradskyella sp. F6397]|uniref:YcxB family protein n=1 Tax=Winogradskyella marina TaxID=2785530 RepID=A0ABS0EK68_9FLAO|nr:hypothetical protein [Winogradskyella marina]MBF8149081.1 hypothetical protein [Winogradskyella marina]